MFSRQWFHPSHYIGVSQSSLLFEEQLNQQSFVQAEHTIMREYSSDRVYWKRQMRRLYKLLDHSALLSRDPSYPLSISFIDFWHDMDPANCQLLDILKLCLPERNIIVINNPQEADLIFSSCYGHLSSNILLNSSSKNILFLGENVRPSYYDFDLSLSFDSDSYLGRNIQLPLWMLELDWFGKQYKDRLCYSKNSITSPFYSRSEDRQKKICFVGNNMEPYRASIISCLQSQGAVVDLYGSHFNHVTDKIKLYSSYHIVFCPENSLHNGYVTEKFIHGFLSGAYFAYSGLFSDSIFNDIPSLINITGLDAFCASKLILSYLDYPLPATIPPLIDVDILDLKWNNIISSMRSSLSQFLPR